MQKQAPTLGRLLVMGGFAFSCFGLLLFLWLAFGGSIPLAPKGYRVKVLFGNGPQLAKEADVRISGVPVGKVKDISPSHGERAVTIQLDRRYAPLPSDSRAILRQKTLLGETYIELTPGTRSKNVRPLKEGATLPRANVAPTVELDQIFRAFDDRTRAAFRVWLQGQAAAVNGRGQDISDALGNLSPFAQDTTRALEILNSQRGAVRALVRNTGDVFAALSERDGQLRGLIENSNRVFATTARRSRELAQAFVVLPTFEREATTTVHRVTRFASNANPLVSQLRPAARQLSPTLKNLSALAPDLRALFRDINPLIDASKKGLPALQQFLDDLRPLLGQLDPFLRNVNPVLTELTRYKRELNAFFSNTVAATEATDKPPKASAPVHYLRTTNPINPETLALSPTRLATDRYNPYIFPNEFDRLGDHLRVYDDRSCGAGGVPALGPVSALFPQGLKDLVNQFALGGGQALAPPCELQPKFPGIGDNTDQSTRYPQVRAQPAP